MKDLQLKNVLAGDSALDAGIPGSSFHSGSTALYMPPHRSAPRIS